MMYSCDDCVYQKGFSCIAGDQSYDDYGNCECFVSKEQYKKAYNKAIDDFAENAKNGYSENDGMVCVLANNEYLSYSNCASALDEYIDEKAEQLKKE